MCTLPLWLCCFASIGHVVSIRVYQKLADGTPFDIFERYTVPQFDEKYFMTSYQPKTGIGNRADINIDSLRKHDVEDGLYGSKKWSHIRFSNTDYVMAKQDRVIYLWKDFSKDNVFEFVPENSVFNRTAKSQIRDAIVFKNRRMLYLALLDGNQLLVFRIEVTGSQHFSTVVEVKGNPVNLSHFRLRNKVFVVVLCRVPEGRKTVVERISGESEYISYVQVTASQARTIMGFVVKGNGYIAVTNPTHCEIHKVDPDLEGSMMHDVLKESGIVSLVHFRLGFDHYLATANSSSQQLYIWKAGGCVSKQEFKIPEVSQLFHFEFPSCRDEIVLVFVRSTGGDIFVWRGQDKVFAPQPIAGKVLGSYIPEPGTIAAFVQGNVPYLLFTTMGATSVLSIHVREQKLPHPHITQMARVRRVMLATQEALRKQERDIENLFDIFSRAVTKDTKQITAKQLFNKVTVKNVLRTQDLRVLEENKVYNSKATIKEFEKRKKHILDSLLGLESIIEELLLKSKDILFKDEKAIIGIHKVIAGGFVLPSLKTKILELLEVGKIEVSKLQQQLYRKSSPKPINAKLSFQQILKILNDVTLGTVNGIDLSEHVMTVNTPQTIKGRVNFASGLRAYGNMEVSGLVNGIDIGEELVTLDGKHKIARDQVFKDRIIASNVETMHVDGIDVRRLNQSALKTTGIQKVTGKLMFKDLNVTSLSVENINGKNSDFLKDIIKADKELMIQGHKTFSSDVEFKGGVNLEGKLNGFAVPEELMLPRVDQLITSPKNFTQVIASCFNVSGTIDDIRIPRDVITLSTDEIIEGDVTFSEGIIVDRDLNVVHFGGISLTDLHRKWKNFDQERFNGTVVLDNMTIKHILSSANGTMVNGVFGNVLLIGDQVIVGGRKEFLDEVTMNRVTLNGKLNGHDMKDFFLSHGRQDIKGKISLKDPVIFKKNLTTGDNIDGVKLQILKKNSISLSQDGSIPGPIRFDALEVLEYFELEGKINSLKFPTDVVLKSHDGIIPNKTFFGSVEISDLTVKGDLTLMGLLNEFNFTDVASKRITLDGDQTLYMNLKVDRITAEMVEVSGTVNNIDVVDLCSKIMSVSKDQVITASKEFFGTVFAENVTAHWNINGRVNLSDIQKHIIKLHGNSTFHRTVTFMEDVAVKSGLKVSMVNDVNITFLATDSVTTSGRHIVTGPTTFDYGIAVKSDIIVGSINGYRIREFLTRSTDQNITGNYTFTDLTFNNNLSVSGLIAGIKVEKEDRPWLLKHKQENIIHGNIIFNDDVTIGDNLEVQQSINGLDVSELPDALHPRKEAVCGVTTIHGLVYVSGNVWAESINGMSTELLQEIVTTDKKHVIPASKEFVGNVTVMTDVTADGSVIISGSINGIDLSEWAKELVYLNHKWDTHISGYKTFTDQLYIVNDLVVSQINGIHLDKLITNSKEPQFIMGTATFHNLHIHGSLEVSGLVNNYDLPALYFDTLMVSGRQTVTGEKIMKGVTNFSGKIYAETLNGESIKAPSDRTMTVFGDYVIQTLQVYNLHVKGFVNGVNLSRLMEEAIYTNTSIIRNQLNFTNLAVQDIVINKNSDVATNVIRHREKFRKFKLHIRNTILNHTECLEDVKWDFRDTLYMLDKFVLHSTVPVTAERLCVDHKVPIIMFYNISDISLEKAEYFIFKTELRCPKYKKSDLRCRKILNSTYDHLMSTVAERTSIADHKMPCYAPTREGIISSTTKDYKGRTIVAVSYPNGTTLIYRQTKFFAEVWEDRDPTSTVVFTIANHIYFAVGRRCNFSSKCTSIYKVERKNRVKVIQKLHGHKIDNLVHFKFSSSHYLAFTDGEPFHATLQPQSVKIYRYRRQQYEKFHLYQKIQFHNATRIRWLEIGKEKEVYLTVINATVINTCRFDGESGFQVQYPIWTSYVEDIGFIFYNNRLYMIAVRSRGASIIYKAVMRGSQWQPYHRFSH